jgi:hypothetical protein
MLQPFPKKLIERRSLKFGFKNYYCIFGKLNAPPFRICPLFVFWTQGRSPKKGAKIAIFGFLEKYQYFYSITITS